MKFKNFEVRDFIDRKEARKMDKFTQYAMVASDEAIADANLNLDEDQQIASGSYLGSWNWWTWKLSKNEVLELF